MFAREKKLLGLFIKTVRYTRRRVYVRHTYLMCPSGTDRVIVSITTAILKGRVSSFKGSVIWV